MSRTIKDPFLGERLRFVHEMAFTVYCAVLLNTTNILLSAQHPVRTSWTGKLQSAFGGTLSYEGAFWLLSLIGGLLLFLCLRIARRFPFSDILLRIPAGLIAVAGFPVATGYVTFRGYMEMLGSLGSALLYAYAPYRWLGIEVIASIACVLFYSSRTLLTGKWLSISLLSLHFGVWTWVLFHGAPPPTFYVLLLGLPVTVIWGFYTSQAKAVG